MEIDILERLENWVADCEQGNAPKWQWDRERDAAAEIRRLRAEAEEHDHSFELRWKADQRAIKRWQEAGSGREMIWPDHADLCVFLLEENDRLRTENAELEKVYQAATAWNEVWLINTERIPDIFGIVDDRLSDAVEEEDRRRNDTKVD